MSRHHHHIAAFYDYIRAAAHKLYHFFAAFYHGTAHHHHGDDGSTINHPHDGEPDHEHYINYGTYNCYDNDRDIDYGPADHDHAD